MWAVAVAPDTLGRVSQEVLGAIGERWMVLRAELLVSLLLRQLLVQLQLRLGDVLRVEASEQFTSRDVDEAADRSQNGCAV